MKPIHPLRRWLFDQQMTTLAFAEKVGVSQGYVSQWLLGIKAPSAKVMAVVARVTKGDITPNDFVAFKDGADKKKRKAA